MQLQHCVSQLTFVEKHVSHLTLKEIMKKNPSQQSDMQEPNKSSHWTNNNNIVKKMVDKDETESYLPKKHDAFKYVQVISYTLQQDLKADYSRSETGMTQSEPPNYLSPAFIGVESRTKARRTTHAAWSNAYFRTWWRQRSLSNFFVVFNEGKYSNVSPTNNCTEPMKEYD